MASPTGGQWLFGPPSGSSTPFNLGLKDSSGTIFPTTVSGAFNIEVFTAAGLTALPTLDSGFDAGVLDPNGLLGTGTNDQGYLRGNPTLFTGDYSVTGGGLPGQITLGSGNQSVQGAAGDTLIGGSGSQVFSAQAGNESVVGSTGADSIYGGVGDSISAGANSYVDGTAGNMQVIGPVSGAMKFAGTSTVAGAGPGTGDTVIGVGNGSINIQSLGTGSVVDLTKTTGVATVSATDGNSLITLGGGVDTVYAGAGDTITAGSVGQYIDGSSGGARIAIGSGGLDTVIGANSGSNTIVGGSGTFNYNPQISGSGDLFNLAGSSGNATINAYQSHNANTGVDTEVSAADTINLGTGSYQVWAGANDRVGVGNATSAGGTVVTAHDGTVTGAVGFGTNDSVAGSSTAQVTIGTGASDNFQVGTDFLFYQNENSTLNSQVVGTATTGGVPGFSGTTVTLPDGTQLNLVGVTTAQLNSALTAGTLFKV